MRTKELISEVDQHQMPVLETGYVKVNPVPVRVKIHPRTYEGEVTGFWRSKQGGTACLTIKDATLRLPFDMEVEKI